MDMKMQIAERRLSRRIRDTGLPVKLQSSVQLIDYVNMLTNITILFRIWQYSDTIREENWICGACKHSQWCVSEDMVSGCWSTTAAAARQVQRLKSLLKTHRWQTAEVQSCETTCGWGQRSRRVTQHGDLKSSEVVFPSREVGLAECLVFSWFKSLQKYSLPYSPFKDNVNNSLLTTTCRPESELQRRRIKTVQQTNCSEKRTGKGFSWEALNGLEEAKREGMRRGGNQRRRENKEEINRRLGVDRRNSWQSVLVNPKGTWNCCYFISPRVHSIKTENQEIKHPLMYTGGSQTGGLDPLVKSLAGHEMVKGQERREIQTVDPQNDDYFGLEIQDPFTDFIRICI